MSRGIVHTTLCLLGFAAALTVSWGCGNTVDPFAESNQHFAIYGFVDAAADTQYVRVEPTRPLLDQSSNMSQIESVTTTNTSTGKIVVWNRSEVPLTDGTSGLVYWAVFRPIPGETYRIDVTQTDGLRSWALTEVPDTGAIDPRKPTKTFSGTIEQQIILESVDRRPEAITVNYDVALTEDDDPIRITLDYNTYGVHIESGWQIDVRLSRDRERVASRLGLDPEHRLVLHEVSMTVRLVSSDWALVGSNHQTNNVVDGFGYFGAASTRSFQWHVDSETVAGLGYEDKQADSPTGG